MNACTQANRHEGHVDQIFRRMTHEQEIGELTDRLGRKTEALAAALGRDVIAEEEAAHRAARRFREEEARNIHNSAGLSSHVVMLHAGIPASLP